MINLKKNSDLLLIITLFTGLLLIGRPTFAQQENQSPDGNNFNLPVSSWVTKGGIHSFFYNLQYALRDTVTWNPHVKNKLSLIMANDALTVAEKELSESKNNSDALKKFEKSINRYQQEIKEISQRTEKFTEKAKNNPKQTAKFLNLNKFTDELLLQQNTLAQLINTAPVQQKTLLENIKENSLNNLAQVLTKIDEPAKIGERLSWAMDKQNNQEVSAKVKNLEIFQSLQEKLPAETQKIVSQTQAKTLLEIKKQAQNLKTAAEKEQLKSMIEKSTIKNSLQSQLINDLIDTTHSLINKNPNEQNNQKHQPADSVFPVVKKKTINQKSAPVVTKPVKKAPTAPLPEKPEITAETKNEIIPPEQPNNNNPSQTEINLPTDNDNVTPSAINQIDENQPKANKTGETTPISKAINTPPPPPPPQVIIIHSRGGGSTGGSSNGSSEGSSANSGHSSSNNGSDSASSAGTSSDSSDRSNFDIKGSTAADN